MKTFSLFNNKGGVGKTTLTFNLAHMLARLGQRVVVIDFDPQSNLTSVFLEDEELAEIWSEDSPSTGTTVAACVDLVRRGKGGVRAPILREVADQLWLLPGHLSLGRFEQPLAEEWPKAFAGDNERALDVITALDLVSNLAGAQVHADLILFDVGPSVGALNRAALLACDAVIIPLAPDLFGIQGLRNVGPTLLEWRDDWTQIVKKWRHVRPATVPPVHDFRPLGYLIQQHLARADRPTKGYGEWAARVPGEYHRHVLKQEPPAPLTFESDPQCLGTIKHFASLAPFAQTARKPMFDLKQADGIGGGQIQAVARCRDDFEQLARRIATRLGAGLPVPI